MKPLPACYARTTLGEPFVGERQAALGQRKAVVSRYQFSNAGGMRAHDHHRHTHSNILPNYRRF